MRGALRLIDANANRAREGLRVLEDLARFILDDAELCGNIKALRHGLSAALAAAGQHPGRSADQLAGQNAGSGFDALAALAQRDTPGDVGTDVRGAMESRRGSWAALASANARRVGEALRAIEETFKLLPSPAWAQIERLRYDLYDLERRLVLAFGRSADHADEPSATPQWRLCVLITESLCLRPWDDVARAALAGGADALQLREKSLPDGEWLRRARRLVEIAHQHASASARPAVIINDRADLALLAGADAVHLGQDDLPIDAVRAFPGAGRLIVGVSTHDLAEARAAWSAGADYCGVGAMFPTTTKPRPQSGPDFLRQYLAHEPPRGVPHLAIGGVRPENLPELLAAGCRGVAVSAAVCAAQDPAAACAQLLVGLKG